MAHTGRTFFKYLKQIISALWKLLLIAVYAAARIAQGIAEMIAKITEKFIS